MQASFTETDATKIQLGQNAIVTFTALPDATVQGLVTQVATTATTSGGVVSFPVTIQLNQPVTGLKPGMSASAEVVVDEVDHTLYVPASAISGTGSTARVSVLQTDGTEVTRTVTVGLRGDTDVQILSGLETGDKVVRTATTTGGTGTGTFRFGGGGGLGGLGRAAGG